MRTKAKISLTIDKELHEIIEKTSKAQKIAKSQIAEQAFKLWLRMETEKLMSKGYEEMYEEDSLFAEKAFEAQREVINE